MVTACGCRGCSGRLGFGAGEGHGVAASVIIRHLGEKDEVSLLCAGIGPNGKGMARIGSFGVWCGLDGGQAQSASKNVARSLALPDDG